MVDEELWGKPKGKLIEEIELLKLQVEGLWKRVAFYEKVCEKELNE